MAWLWDRIATPSELGPDIGRQCIGNGGADAFLGSGERRSYRLIGIYSGDNSSHCMACYTGLKDIAFFDPNFGEFWFEDKRKFQKRFTEAFYVRSLCSKMMNDHSESFDYAQRAF
ncbi:MAG TPA: YopT-type cysteine protease domain-containing protein [Acetobacteraceae bacterium]|nr:YopT-type cysteine protease domain-containing protein [Acetobacteraceae bacterium]